VTARLPLLALLLGLAACGRADAPAPPADVHETRGVFLGLRFEGAAASIEHEAIPGVMDAMRMDLRLADPAEVEGLAPGDKVRFELAVTGRGPLARGFERLPDTTSLAVPSTQGGGAR